MAKQVLETDEVEVARLFGLIRVVAGAALFLAPRKTARAWTGQTGDEPVSTLAVRGMGARDVAIGLGLLIALERGAPVRGWLEAGVLIDASDAAGTLMSWSDLGTPRALFWFATEVGSAYYGSRLAQTLD